MFFNWVRLSIVALSALCVVVGVANAEDRLKDAVVRLGYWHFQSKRTVINNGASTTTEQDFNKCIDLRNPKPPATSLARFSCSDFNVQKSQTSYHLRATCTFANNGHLAGRTDIELGRDGISAVYHEQLRSSWTTPTGTSASLTVVSSGRLSGACPAGTLPAAPAQLNGAETAIIQHNR